MKSKMKNKPIQLAKVVKRDYNHETRGLNHVKIKPSEQNVVSVGRGALLILEAVDAA
jgi:hypothetical protein